LNDTNGRDDSDTSGICHPYINVFHAFTYVSYPDVIAQKFLGKERGSLSLTPPLSPSLPFLLLPIPATTWLARQGQAKIWPQLNLTNLFTQFKICS
jgi:hypothetical protein